MVEGEVWKHVVQKGDTVIDATCGNGFDTLALLNLVADDDSHNGYVYALDIQKDALDKTSLLLEESLNSNESELYLNKLRSFRLIAFNLGYLPGGDKEIITRSETTLLALEAAKRILIPGGLIGIVVYIGHPGGREELEAVETFSAKLSVENWICCKLQMLNRPCAPIPIFLFRR
ncbi:putative rRNA methylase YtqB [Trifolium pratense]|uniref:putative rRNA methylase YtqB n=1 Tax=Trifolium pratense TaxID=57577 RepID=UPI001E69163A|nr:putative rRNA methylase YtqB [Trifolium pratense]